MADKEKLNEVRSALLKAADRLSSFQRETTQLQGLSSSQREAPQSQGKLFKSRLPGFTTIRSLKKCITKSIKITIR